MFVRHLGVNETKILVYAGNFSAGNEPKADKKSGRFGFENFHLSQTLFSKTAALKTSKSSLQLLSSSYFKKNCKETFPQKIQNEFPDGHRNG